MDASAFLVAGGGMAALGVGLASVLAIANKTLYVPDDPRVDAVDELLPQANCGACGYPGCRAFAEKLVAGEVTPEECSASSEESIAAIAALLGVQAAAREKQVARLACAGGHHVTRMQARYHGLPSCRAASLVSGGPKDCPWGCLGFGDCEAACPFDAIVMNEYRLPVVDADKCTACGKCVEACPKNLFSIHPVSHRLWVSCRNQLMGKAAREQCDVACIGCGLCAKDGAEGLIEIRNNLAIIDYEKNDEATIDAIQRCPTGAILWIDEGQGAILGAKALEAREKAAQAAMA